MNRQPPISAACHLCGSMDLELSPDFGALHRVTSDCKPWSPGGMLARCLSCHLVQTPVTETWRTDADRIYSGYAIYHQSGGREQHVFQPGTGASQPRSEQIVRSLLASLELPSNGRLLDIGCGNGSFLSAWSGLRPGWSLVGTEVNDKYRSEIEAIPGVEHLHTGGLDELAGSFDVISLIHVLEHIPHPLDLLRAIRRRLTPEGILLIEVPNCAENPFILLVADHCSHFAPELLGGVVEAAGYVEVHPTRSWVAKEISLTARRGPADAPSTSMPPLSREASERVLRGVATLDRIAREAADLSGRPNFGLFGTAIAATWLDAQTDGAARFFVDEDPARIGRTHLGRPIVAPSQIPQGATVYVALPGPLAVAVANRLGAVGRGLEVFVP